MMRETADFWVTVVVGTVGSLVALVYEVVYQIRKPPAPPPKARDKPTRPELWDMK